MSTRDSRATQTPPPARRRRAWPWMAAIACALVGWYLWRAASLWYARPVIAFDLVDFLEEQQPKPGPEGSAFPVYIEAFDGNWPSMRPAISAQNELASRAAVDDAARTQMCESHRALEPRIAVLRRLAAHPVLCMPVMRDPREHPEIAAFAGFELPEHVQDRAADSIHRGPISIMLPSAQFAGAAARLLAADAALAAEDGDFDRATADLEAAIYAASHAGETAVWISAWGQLMNGRSIASTIRSIIENHGERVTDIQLERLAQIVGRLARPVVARTLEVERRCTGDTIQRLYSDDGGGGGELLPVPMLEFEELTGYRNTDGPRVPWKGAMPTWARFLASPVLNRWRDDRAWTGLMADRVQRIGNEALGAPSGKALDAHLRRLDTINEMADEWRQPVLARTYTGYTNLVIQERILRLERDATLAAIGIEQFRRAHARFPASLDELSAFVGMQLGADNSPSNPWRYAVVDGRPVIYDFGVDGVDDGARPAAAFLNEMRGGGAQWSPWGDRSKTCASLSASASVRTELPQPKDGVWPALQPVVLGELCDPTTRTTQPATTLSPDARFGDTVWVLWRSGARGWSRLVRLKPDNGELGAVPEDG